MEHGDTEQQALAAGLGHLYNQPQILNIIHVINKNCGTLHGFWRWYSYEEQATGAGEGAHDHYIEGSGPIQYTTPKGTKEDPKLVPSITNKRIVGCICEEDNLYCYLVLAAQRQDSDAQTVGPITSWCPISWPTDPPS
jgi:hypothetical protein